MARKKRKRTIKRRATKARARRRSGISVSELGGKRRSRRKSPRKYGAMATGAGLDSWKRAATASILLRLMRSGARLLIEKAGINFPALSLAVPAAVAVAASKKMIDVPGLFPMAVDHTVNAIIDYFPALKKAADLDFGTKPIKGYNQNMGAITPRSYRDTMRAIEARSGLSVTDRPMSYGSLSITDSPSQYSGYTQD